MSESNVGQNVGVGGVGFYKGKNPSTKALQTKNLNSDDFTVTDDVVNDEVKLNAGPNISKINTANTYSAGSKQIFQHNTTTAGLKIASANGDPSNPEDGDVWYNDILEKFRKRENGVTSDLNSIGTVTHTNTIRCKTYVPEGSNCYADVHSLSTAGAKISGYVFPDVTGSLSTLNFSCVVPDSLSASPNAKFRVQLMTRGAQVSKSVSLRFQHRIVTHDQSMDVVYMNTTSEGYAIISLSSTIEDRIDYIASFQTQPSAGDLIIGQLSRNHDDVKDDYLDDVFAICIDLIINRDSPLIVPEPEWGKPALDAYNANLIALYPFHGLAPDNHKDIINGYDLTETLTVTEYDTGGKFGQGYLRTGPGSPGHLARTNFTQLPIGDFTISFWGTHNNPGGIHQSWIGQAGNIGLMFRLNGSGYIQCLFYGSWKVSSAIGGWFNGTGEFSMYTWVRRSGHNILYYNGDSIRLNDNGYWTDSLAGEELRIWNEADPGGDPFINQLGIWNVALPLSAISDLYNDGVGCVRN